MAISTIKWRVRGWEISKNEFNWTLVRAHRSGNNGGVGGSDASDAADAAAYHFTSAGA